MKNLKKLLSGTVIAGLTAAYILVQMDGIEALAKMILTAVLWISIGSLVVAGIMKKAKKI